MMKTFNYMLRLICITTASIALTGCLSSGGDDSTAAPSSTPTPPPPPSSNSAPTISGNPPGAVNVGDPYSFRPTASDSDGDTLTFSITNKPSWLNFSTTTGEISGTPMMGDIGTYSDISITVDDGQAQDSISPFSVEVTQVQLGSVTLSWSAPTQNSDGSALTDLSAYKIYYGTTAGSYPNQVEIDNPSVTTYVLENLVPDTYYFVATAVNSSGVESEFSNSAQHVVSN